jgi:hypothetical protein
MSICGNRGMSSNGTKNRNKPSKLSQDDFEGLSYPI